MKGRRAGAALGAAGIVGFLALCEAVSRFGVVSGDYFPPLTRVSGALVT